MFASVLAILAAISLSRRVPSADATAQHVIGVTATPLRFASVHLSVKRHTAEVAVTRYASQQPAC